MNSDYRIECAKLAHFYEMKVREYDSAIFTSYDNPDQFISQYLNMSYAFTGFYKDDIIGIAGLLPLGPGKAEAWMFSSVDFVKHHRWIYRTIKQRLTHCEMHLNLDRIQSVCYNKFKEAHTFIRHLGFHLETPDGMRNYGPNGETYLLYARIKYDKKT